MKVMTQVMEYGRAARSRLLLTALTSYVAKTLYNSWSIAIGHRLPAFQPSIPQMVRSIEVHRFPLKRFMDILN